MTGAPRLLPPGFETLEPFAARWAAPSAAERDRLRAESSEADRAAFYDACRDRAAPALAMLDRKPIDDLDERERRLLDLMLCFAHVAIAVEIQGDLEEGRTQARRHLRITRSSADLL
jgi:hypothetical protein